MPSTSPRAWGTKLASCAHCLAFIAFRAAATARAAGVESESAMDGPACTAVFGAVEGALPARAGAGATSVAAGVPATGTKVPSACKTNLAGPAASVDGEGAEAADWAQPGV